MNITVQYKSNMSEGNSGVALDVPSVEITSSVRRKSTHRLSYPHLYGSNKRLPQSVIPESTKFSSDNLKILFLDLAKANNNISPPALTVEQAYLFSCMTLVAPAVGDFEEVILSMKEDSSEQKCLASKPSIGISLTDTATVDFSTFIATRVHFKVPRVASKNSSKNSEVLCKFLMLLLSPITAWMSFAGNIQARQFLWKVMSSLQISYTTRLKMDKPFSILSFFCACLFTILYAFIGYDGMGYVGGSTSRYPECVEKGNCDYLFMPKPPASYSNITSYVTPELVECKTNFTTLEAMGPALLILVFVATLGSFITDNSSAEADDEANKLFQRLGGFTSKIVGRGGSMSVGQLVMSKLNKVMPLQRKRQKWSIRHDLVAVVITIPYLLIPFVARYQHKCTVFWHWKYEVNIIMYSGGIINFLLAYKFMHLLLHAFYLFHQKLCLMTEAHNLLYDDRGDEMTLDLFGSKVSPVNWFLVNHALSQTKAEIFERFNKIITGLGLVFLLYVGFFYAMTFGGWADDIDGSNITYVAGYTVFMAGGYITFPILSIGIRINMTIDRIKSRLADLVWIASATGSPAEQTWVQLKDRYIANAEYLKILWFLPLSPDLLRTLVTLIITTVASAVYSSIPGPKI